MLQNELEKIWSGWKVDKLLGEGSFGKVYRIEREDFGHIYEAALKVIKIPQNQSEITTIVNDGMDEGSVTMYFRSIVEDIVEEFALMSQLKGNTNIVCYEDHAVVQQEDGIGWTIYIRMELLEPLFDYQREKKMSIRDVIRLGIDMCNALEICQKYNIIHRDIKPENMFVSKLGKYKLGDFGIARQLEKTSSALSKKGTYTYMAPEVYKGEQYNSNVDIYSLGVVLYRFLNNNRTPFLPDYPEPIRYSDKERANVMRMSGTPMEKPCNAEGRLAEIILKACAYDPKERYESAVDMRKALESVLYDEEEAKVIYPKGDTLNHENPEYILEKGETKSDLESEKEEVENKREIEMEEDIDQAAEEATSILPAETISEEVEEGTMLLFEDINRNTPKKEPQKDDKEVSEKVDKEETDRASKIEVERSKQEEEKKAQKDKTEEAKKEEIRKEEKNNKEASEKAKKEAENKGKGKKKAMVAVIAGIVVIGGIAAFMAYQKTQESVVPCFINLTIEEAQQLASQGEYKLNIIEAGSEYSENVEKGDIISQSVEEGNVVKKGDNIEVIVSKGATVGVPNVVGSSSQDAEGIIVAAGLNYKVAEEQYSEDIPKGTVISQDIAEGTVLEEGQTVSVVISKGIEKIEVPDVEGKTLKKAKTILKEAGLKCSAEEEYSSSVEKGKVISQSVTAGKMVEKEANVKLVVSKGEKPQTSTNNSSTKTTKKSTSSKKKTDSIDSWNLVN